MNYEILKVPQIDAIKEVDFDLRHIDESLCKQGPH